MGAAKGLKPGNTFTEGNRSYVVEKVNPDGSYEASAVTQVVAEQNHAPAKRRTRSKKQPGSGQ